MRTSIKNGIGAGIAILTLLAAPAVAQQADAPDAPPPPQEMRGQGGPPPGPRGPITRADVQTQLREHFARIDANGDGVITRAEFDAARAAMRDRRGPPPGGPDAADAPPPPPPSGGPDAGGPPPRGGMGGMMMMGGRWFDRADADHDGRVTLAEAEGGAMRLFDMVDLNHDGIVSPEEQHAAMEMMRAMRGRGREQQ